MCRRPSTLCNRRCTKRAEGSYVRGRGVTPGNFLAKSCAKHWKSVMGMTFLENGGKWGHFDITMTSQWHHILTQWHHILTSQWHHILTQWHHILTQWHHILTQWGNGGDITWKVWNGEFDILCVMEDFANLSEWLLKLKNILCCPYKLYIILLNVVYLFRIWLSLVKITEQLACRRRKFWEISSKNENSGSLKVLKAQKSLGE